ncbi:MAG TPA: vWA domain-containing protein [Vicinamibacterales bacterium]|nr:vWA domain-containing protein [Vicinamibacterales bacterium]
MKTDITVILDRSGSMEVRRSDAIGGFNALVDDQKVQPGVAALSLVQFDTSYQVSFTAKTPVDVPALTMETYNPSGGTALLDAMGKTISATGQRLAAMPEADRPGKVIVVIITDGEENSSREFTYPQVNEMIGHQRDVYQWEFIFVGTNQDAIASAAKIGIAPGSALTYGTSGTAARAAMGAVAQSLSERRAGHSGEFSPAARSAAMAGEEDAWKKSKKPATPA